MSSFHPRRPYLRVDGEEGRIAGDFLIRLARDPEVEDYMDLRVGLSGVMRVTPRVPADELAGIEPGAGRLAQDAIRAGTVEQGYFQYQGALNKGAPTVLAASACTSRCVTPSWPSSRAGRPLQQGRGEVLVEDSGVRVLLPKGGFSTVACMT